MFELIGLLVWALIFFSLSGVLGCLFAFVAWLMLRRRPRSWRKILVAALIPPAVAVYMAACVTVLPGYSLFGDIDEPLPNGFTLKALGKMPDRGSIEIEPATRSQPHLAGEIGKVGVYGSDVVGWYSYPFDLQESSAIADDQRYFVLDTQSGRVENFATVAQISARIGEPVSLVETQFFQSQDPSKKRLVLIDQVILFVPPSLAFVGLLLFLVRARRTVAPL